MYYSNKGKSMDRHMDTKTLHTIFQNTRKLNTGRRQHYAGVNLNEYVVNEK